ncbi:MAG: hypothetical protein QG581_146 [Patescibacteria group bacterium]|jgi:hypothetical protein|nr:hypothetical protein [Patescibacteria group bacterium]
MKASFENVKPLIHCPLCDRKYEPKEMLLLEEERDRTVFHLTCKDCQASTFIFVSAGPMGVASFGVLTDVDHTEAKRIFGSDPVSSDDVIEMHRFLKEHKGVESLLVP